MNVSTENTFRVFILKCSAIRCLLAVKGTGILIQFCAVIVKIYNLRCDSTLTIKDSWDPTDPKDEVVTSAMILLIEVGPISRNIAPGFWPHLSVVEYTSIFRFPFPGGKVMISSMKVYVMFKSFSITLSRETHQ